MVVKYGLTSFGVKLNNYYEKKEVKLMNNRLMERLLWSQDHQEELAEL
ncbi:hypothetical protein NGI46_12595 [Peribacillus butanolivorans]|nr:hypothetical protein [Peribacillus butanolivorans]